MDKVRSKRSPGWASLSTEEKFSKLAEWMEGKRSKKQKILQEAEGKPGGYKVLVRAHSLRGRNFGSGKTIADVRHLSEARDFIKDAASNSPEGTQFYVRYSKPSKRSIPGYRESNTEAYVVFQGEPALVWTKSKDKRGMGKALQEQSEKASYIDRYLETHHAEL